MLHIKEIHKRIICEYGIHDTWNHASLMPSMAVMQAAESRANSMKAEQESIAQKSVRQAAEAQNAMDKIKDEAAAKLINETNKARDAEMQLQTITRSFLVRLLSVSLLSVRKLHILETDMASAASTLASPQCTAQRHTARAIWPAQLCSQGHNPSLARS